MSEKRYDELRDDLELPEHREQPERERRQEPRDAPEGTAEKGARGVAEGELGGRDLGARDDEGFADEHAGELELDEDPLPTRDHPRTHWSSRAKTRRRRKRAEILAERAKLTPKKSPLPAWWASNS